MTHPAKTGPMKKGWTSETPALMTALMGLRQQINHALDKVQVGEDIPIALYDSIDNVLTYKILGD